MRVFVYRNLHKGLWSVKALEGPNKGRVIDRASHVLLEKASGRVSEAGRRRVLRDRRKNVHAGIVGELLAGDGDWQDHDAECAWVRRTWDRVTYNPYRYDRFVYAETEAPYEGSLLVELSCDGRVYVS